MAARNVVSNSTESDDKTKVSDPTRRVDIVVLPPTRSDRVLAVAKVLQANVRAFVGNPQVQVVSVSGGGTAVAMGFSGALAGGAVGAAAGLAVGVVPALFTFGLSIPVGGIIGATIGGGCGAVVGSGTGFVGGGTIGGVAYAYRVQIVRGKVYVFARLKDVSDYTQRKAINAGNAAISATKAAGSATKRKSLQLGSAISSVAAQRRYQVTAATAAGGGAVGGIGGGAVGLATGAVVGGAAGVVPAIFTFGLSIPFGAVVGGGVGACAGGVVGTSTGAVVGGGAGYGTYTKRKEIANAVTGTATYVKDTGSAGRAFISRKVRGNKGDSGSTA